MAPCAVAQNGFGQATAPAPSAPSTPTTPTTPPQSSDAGASNGSDGTKGGEASFDPRRKEFHAHLGESQRQRFNLFGSLPVGHVIPRRERISIATEAQWVDATIAPEGSDLSQGRAGLTHRLDVKGYSITPLVAFSANRVGIGFTGEYSARSVRYLVQPNADDASVRQLQEGEMRASGVGLYLYHIPKLSFMPKSVTANVVFGGKQLSVAHDVRETARADDATTSWEKYRYSVNKYDIGLDVSVLFVKRFSVVPWMNYAIVKVGEARAADGSASGAGATTAPERNSVLAADRDLLWSTVAPFSYGIDFAITVGRTDLHLGGLLGLVGNLVNGSDRISDRGATLGLSYEFK